MKRTGFSLIELMVVVAIIALLAMLAIPNFSRFIAKTKRTEAYVNLNAIYIAQKAYWAEHGRYSAQLMGDQSIGWKPEGYHGGGETEQFYYTYGFPGGEGTTCFTGKLLTSSSHLGQARASDNEFVVVAAGDIDNDGEPDILIIDQNGLIKIIKDDLAD